MARFEIGDVVIYDGPDCSYKYLMTVSGRELKWCQGDITPKIYYHGSLIALDDQTDSGKLEPLKDHRSGVINVRANQLSSLNAAVVNLDFLLV